MRRVVIITCLLLALTACRSQDPIEPTPTPTTPTTSSAGPDPDATPPTLPAQARKNTPEGAAAFVVYWVKTFNYAARTGDSAPLRKASKDCKPCAGYADDFADLDDERRPSSDPWQIRRVRVSATRDPIEVFTTIRVLRSSGGSERFDLTFALTNRSPFFVRAIRGDQS